MNKIIARLFLFSALLLFLTQFIFPASTIDIQFYDTYFVVAYQHLAALLAFGVGIWGGIYWIVGYWKNLNKWLSLTHFVLIQGSAFLGIYSIMPILAIDGYSRRYYSIYDAHSSFFQKIFFFSLTCGLVAVVVFVVNLLISPRQTNG